MSFDEELVVADFKKEIEKLKHKDKHNADFLIFKKQHEYAASQLDDKINNIYSASNMSTVSQINLPEPIKKEIIYYNFISDNYDEVSFADNISLIKEKLKDFDSPYASYLDEMIWKLDNGYIELKGRDWLTEFFQKWTFMLTKRILDFRLKQVEELRYSYLVEIYSIIKTYDKFTKLYDTFYDVFGRVANIDDELKNKNIESIASFADFINKDPSILKIAELLGRMNSEDDKMEKNITEQITTHPEKVKLPYNPEEIVGLTLSKNIERVLPMELANLFDPDLEMIFYKKFIEGELQSFLFESNEEIIEHEIEEVEYDAPIPLNQGKFIICIDTSSSMEGAGEYISKALAIAIVKVALKEFRDVIIINFASKDISEFKVSARNLELSKMIDFFSKSFYGQTNSTQAFERAINKMTNEEFKRSDFIMISDFMMASISNKIRLKLADLKDQHNRFHSLIVGRMPNVESQSIFDNIMYYNPDDPFSTQQIVKSINETLRNLRTLKDEELTFRDQQIAELNTLRDKKRIKKVITEPSKKNKKKHQQKLDKIKEIREKKGI